MTSPLADLVVTIEPDEDADDLELAELTTGLRSRLLELDVHRADLVRSAEIPAGAKPVEAVELGALLVSLSPALLTAAVDLVREWLANRPVRAVRIVLDGDSLELTGASRRDQREITEAFLQRHRP